MIIATTTQGSDPERSKRRRESLLTSPRTSSDRQRREVRRQLLREYLKLDEGDRAHPGALGGKPPAMHSRLDSPRKVNRRSNYGTREHNERHPQFIAWTLPHNSTCRLAISSTGALPLAHRRLVCPRNFLPCNLTNSLSTQGKSGIDSGAFLETG